MAEVSQINPNGAGRPSLLTDEQCLKMRERILMGDTLQEMANACGIGYSTIEQWRWANYRGFADKLRLWRMEKRFEKTEENIDVLLDSEDEKVKKDMTIFVAETLGKTWYSKRTELTGAEGKPVGVVMIPTKGIETIETTEITTATEAISLPSKNGTDNTLGTTTETEGISS